MAKMYYTEQEAAAKLGIAVPDLAKLIQERRLRVYADGPRKMYRVGEVDALVTTGKGESGEIELTPADTGTRDAVAISGDTGQTPPGKEDTVITSDGISIFDDEDLEIETADPMAKTTIAPSVEDQVSLEGVGSGSGLLDLTRESDDTSLGAEVLEHIDVEGAVPSGGPAEESAAMPSGFESEPVAAAAAPVEVSPEIDPSAGLFAGLAGAACLVMIVVTGFVVAAILDATPPFVAVLQENVTAFLIGSLVAAVVLAAIGYFVGKSVAGRQLAVQRSA